MDWRNDAKIDDDGILWLNYPINFMLLASARVQPQSRTGVKARERRCDTDQV